MTKFYSGTGDDGTTGLLGEERVEKFDLRMETLGTLDELSAVLGLARSQISSEEIQDTILRIQKQIYELMSEVAATAENSDKFHKIFPETVSGLEEEIDRISETTETPKGFIVPGETIESATLSVARAIVRRSERRAVELYKKGDLKNEQILRYLNRLSSLLFILEIRLIQDFEHKKIRYAKDVD